MNEDELKALFVVQFIQNISWEETKQKSDTILIGVVGSTDVFYNILSKVISRNPVSGKVIIVEKIGKEPEILSQYHLIYFDTKNVQYYKRLLTIIENTNTVTVANHRSFLDYNGSINMVRKNDKFRYKINYEELSRQKIVTSNSLMEFALNTK